MEKIDIGVGGMSCQGCVKNVTAVLQALPGVSDVKVALEAGTASIAYDPAVVGVEQFQAAVEGAGFDFSR